MPVKQKQAWQGYLLILLAGSCWGIGGLFISKMNRLGASADLTAFTGQALGAIVILIFLLFRLGPKGLAISRQGLIYAGLLGVLTKGVFKLALDHAIIKVGMATASVLLYLAPVFAVAMSIIFFREKIKRHQYLAVLLNILGCFLMVTGGNLKQINLSGIGLVLGVTAAFLYALSSILGKLATLGDHPLTMSFYMILFSSITIGVFARPWQYVEIYANRDFIFWAIINAVIASSLANILFLTGLSYPVETSRVPIVSSIEVVVASLAGILLLGEKINWVGIMGIVILILSIFLMNWRSTSVGEQTAEA